MNKITKIFLVLLVLFISISAVSAEGNFTALKNDIDTSTTAIEINQNYVYDNTTDYNLNHGILIDKSDFAIDGKGHTIDASNQARIFNITGDNITISNLNLINANSTGSYGGAIFSTGSIILNNVTFTGNTAENGGALLIGLMATLNNVKFTNNKAGNGAAILIQGKTTINNSIFTNNQAAENGGAVYIQDETTINNSIFTNNQAAENGGALYITREVTINNVTFTRNQALYGGAICSINTTEIRKSNFNNNTAKWGGDLYLTNTTNISDSSFINSLSKYAGAIYSNGTITISDSIFKNLHANVTAGAIALKNLKYGEINNCTFMNTSAVKNGGAIYIDDNYDSSSVKIRNSKFINSYGDFGGALVQLQGNLTIENSIFIGNTAKYEGGAIYTSNVYLKMNNTLFESNQIMMPNDSFDGGALYLDDTITHSTYLTFINNTKNAIYGYYTYLNMSNSKFKNNGEAIHSVFTSNILANNTYNNDTLNLNDTNYVASVTGNGMNFNLTNNTINVTNIPTRFDLREWGWLTPVKDQGDMGACWSFGSIGAIESALLKSAGLSYDFSENNLQHAMLKYSKYGVKEAEEGGYPDYVLGYLLSWFGPIPEENDTYDELGKISPLLAIDESPHIQDIVLLKEPTSLKDNDIYKQAIMKYGGIDITYYAYQDAPYYNNKTAAQYQNKTTNQTHAVVLIGWDDNFSASNFLTTPPGDGAWIIKNSWNTTWGDKGYGYISYYDTSILKYKYNLAFIMENNETYTTNYQTDLGGSLTIEEYNKNVSYKVKYDILTNELIRAVGTYFKEEGESYSLEIYINDELVHTQNGTAPFRGFHTIKLDKEFPVKADDVVMALITKQSIPLVNESRQHYIYNMSFVNRGDKWIDIYKENKTISLKVYTEKIAIYSQDLVKVYKSPSQFEVNVGVANQTVTFEINGRNYTRTSDKNGTAIMTINLGPGNYTVKTRFNGSEAENNITVLPTLLADSLVKYFRNASQFDIQLINGTSKPVAGVNITMNINGVFYNRTTDSNGTARLNINLPPGEYILTALDPITGLQMSYNITVLPTINATDLEMKYKDGSTFNAMALDGQGNPVKGATIRFNVNGVFYNRITDSDGIAKLNINLMAGKYIITSEYDGLKVANTITIRD